VRWNNKKVLVTGAEGFIGSHLVDELVKLGKKVISLDDLSGGFKENVNSEAEFIEGSVTDKELIEKVFKENQIDFVFHFAAYAAEGLSHFIRKFNYENNLIGSINVIDESVKSKVKCFVFASSIAVYGKNQLPMKEGTIPTPEDPYGIAKYAIEQDLEAAHRMFGLNYIAFRMHNVYGARQHIGDKYRNVIGIFMNQILQDKPITIFGDGEQTRAFTHIDDITPTIAKSISERTAYNEVFNLGSDEPHSVKALAQEVLKVMNKGETHSVSNEQARKEVVHAYCDHEKAKTILGYEAKVSLQDGLKNMAEWVNKVGIRATTKFDNIEIEENLPPSWKK